jgi:YfiH family protein
MLPPAFLSRKLGSFASVRHGFFGREGGVSEGPFAALNVSQSAGDDPARVGENRRRIAASFGADAVLVGVRQVHSARAIFVERAEDGGVEADALVTARPCLALTILTADCAPILLADAQAGVVGAAHAGWKGALTGAAEACVAAMENLGAEASRIVAAIGPAIRQPSYEVGPEFRASFLREDEGAAEFFKDGPSGRPHFDLPAYVRARLGRVGVGAVEILPFDTYSEPQAFFSHRRATHEGAEAEGRQASAIMLVG